MTRIFRLSLYLLVGLLLGACASLSFAASYGSTTNKGFPGGAWKGTGTISGTTPQTIESINVGGKYVAVPMLGSLGAAALEAAIIGVKNAPKTVGGPLVLGWLASQGIKYINDNWVKQGDSIPVPPSASGCWQDAINGVSSCQSSPQAVCDARKAQFPHLASYTVTYFPTTTTSGVCKVDTSPLGYPSISGQSSPCPAGYTHSAGACFPNDYVPVGESDWEQVYGNTPPAQVLQELCSRLQSGCNAAPVTTQPVTSPLSDWKTDPVTGVQTRQTVKITPAPTPENPERVQVDITVETKTTTTTTNPETGETSTAEQTSAESDKNPDFCVLHPKALACAELGEPENVDTKADTRNVVIAPGSGWGAGSASCPQPKTHVLRTGHTVTMSWQPVCDGAGMFRPVVIGLSWLAAIYAFMAIHRKSQA